MSQVKEFEQNIYKWEVTFNYMISMEASIGIS